MAPDQKCAPDAKSSDLLSVPPTVKKRSSTEVFIGVQTPREIPPPRAKSIKIEIDPYPGEDVDISTVVEQYRRKRLESKKDKPRVCQKVRYCDCELDIFNSQNCSCKHEFCCTCFWYDQEPLPPIVPDEATKEHIPEANYDDVWEKVRAGRVPVSGDGPTSSPLGRDLTRVLLYRYARLLVNILASRTLKPIEPAASPKFTASNVTVVVPTIFKNPQRLIAAVQSISANKPHEIIVITTTANQERVDELIQSLDESKNIKIQVDSVAEPNKRNQMVLGIEKVPTEITVFADDDITWKSPKLLQWILAPFEARSGIGGVATCQRLERDASSITQYFWQFLGAIYIERRSFDCAATVCVDGGIPCISGRTAAYRTSILKDPKFLNEFPTETWRGNGLNSDDDNFLTRWLDLNGHEIYFQNHPDALVLTTLENNSEFLYQCLRWARSNWRSNLQSMFLQAYIWRQHPYSAYAVYLTTLSPPTLIQDGALIWLCHKAAESMQAPHRYSLYLLFLWMFLTKIVKFLSYYRRHPLDLVLLPVSILFGYAHGFIKVYAALTLHVTAWRKDSSRKINGPTTSTWERIQEKMAPIKTLSSLVWPSGNWLLQLHLLGIVLCLLLDRAVNMVVPFHMGAMTNTLLEKQGVSIREMFLFCLAQLLDDGSLTIAVRQLLWKPLEHYWTEKSKILMFDRVMNPSSDFRDTENSAMLADRISAGDVIGDFISLIFLFLIPLLLDTTLTLVSYYYYFNIWYASALTLMTAVLPFTIWNLSPDLHREYRGCVTQERNIVNESISNWEAVFYFNGFVQQREELTEAIHAGQRCDSKLTNRMALISIVKICFIAIGFLAVCARVIDEAGHRTINAGELITLSGHLVRHWNGPLGHLGNTLSRVASLFVKMEPLLDIREPSTPDGREAPVLDVSRGEIEFDRVSFSYGKNLVLDGVSFKIRGGQVVALIGESGSGKSTILDLLLRRYAPSSGSIRIDGKDIRHVESASIRDKISFVPQNPRFFSKSVKDNVRYARNISDQEVIDACKMAAIHGDILEHPEAYSRSVTANSFSGGQLQRLAIARAVSKGAPIFVLDEPMNHLDNETGAKIQENLQGHMKDRTTIIVTHRLVHTVEVDTIIVIGNGRIIEQGNHRDLLLQNGPYSRLWAKEMGKRKCVFLDLPLDIMSEIVDLVNPKDLVSLACVKSLRDIATMKLYESIHLDDGSKLDSRIRRLRKTVRQDSRVAGYIRSLSISLSEDVKICEKIKKIILKATNLRSILLHSHRIGGLATLEPRNFLTELDLASLERLEVLHVPITTIFGKDIAQMPSFLQELTVDRSGIGGKKQRKFIHKLTEYVRNDMPSSLKRITLQTGWPEWEGNICKLREICEVKNIELDILCSFEWEAWDKI